ncbi:OGA GlcNAcase, partial [Atractosteus spatula]|nr:OGA GlcNAcase [Atractosteus spatula]
MISPYWLQYTVCVCLAGFYGRPWSMEQRKVLFQWMQRWGLNTYLYGPKDDLKHRLLWREVYSPEEAAQLRPLVEEAASQGLQFVYALSPGQDIVFSSPCDVGLLKRKLKQVADFGCKAFAILFDDIDHSLCQADKEAFSSFAHAQVSVANEIFRFLGEPPIFLFCPTEYCNSLCSPSLAKSPYLNTVGEDLLPGITVIWTGNKVISRELSVASVMEVQAVLQRPPLVWDNLHANDYDSRRVFLGPFKGRPPGLRAHLRGLLLNPNCEFEANYISLHTLGTWHRLSAKPGQGGEVQQVTYCPEEALLLALKDWMQEMSKPLQPALTLRVCLPPAGGEVQQVTYCPEEALLLALKDWMQEMSKPLQPVEGAGGGGSSVNVLKGLKPTTVIDLLLTRLSRDKVINFKELHRMKTSLRPITRHEAVMSVKREETEQCVSVSRQCRPAGLKSSESDSDLKNSESAVQDPATRGSNHTSAQDILRGRSALPAAPPCTAGVPKDKGQGEQELDVAPRSEDRGLRLNSTENLPRGETEGEEGEREAQDTPASKELPLVRKQSQEKGKGGGAAVGRAPLSEEEVKLLVGLYYLPHEHGPPAQRLLQDLAWLKAHSHCVSANGKKGEPQKVEEWRLRAGRFQQDCDRIARLHGSVVNCTNRAVLYDLYPYIWDLRNTVLVAKAFVSWLDGRVLNDNYPFGSWRNCFYWCRTNASVDLLGVESEPWVFKGGLSGEFQMLLPTGTNNDLFSHPPPLSRLYNIRPYQTKDKVELYRICRQLHLKTQSSPDAHQPHPDLMGDWLGACFALCQEYSFVLEDERGLCGCALGALDIRAFLKRSEATWLPTMREKHPRGPGAASHPAAQEALQYFHSEHPDYPDSLLYHFPSVLRLEALPEVLDTSVTRSLVTSLLSALKANGSQGVFCEVLPTDRSHLEFFTKLGFLEIFRCEAVTREEVVLGRLL